jgi:hypothetical protein
MVLANPTKALAMLMLNCPTKPNHKNACDVYMLHLLNKNSSPQHTPNHKNACDVYATSSEQKLITPAHAQCLSYVRNLVPHHHKAHAQYNKLRTQLGTSSITPAHAHFNKLRTQLGTSSITPAHAHFNKLRTQLGTSSPQHKRHIRVRLARTIYLYTVYIRVGLARTIYVCMVYIRYFWQGFQQIYNHIRCIYTQGWPEPHIYGAPTVFLAG